jgi:type IX secretion system PorP/SprF family membrane protein
MKKTIILSFILFLAFSGKVQSQDIHMAQIQESPLFINPANTGFFAGYYRIAAGYRNQWASMGKPYQTMNLSVDGGLLRNRNKSSFLGLGLNIFNDKAGSANISNTVANLNIAAIIKLGSKSALSAGIYGGISMNNGNYNKLTYASQFNGTEIDPGRDSHENVAYHSFTYSDLGGGIAYEFTKYKKQNDRDYINSFRLGIAAYHLNKPKQDFGNSQLNPKTGEPFADPYRMPTRFVASFMSRFDLPNSKYTLTPTFIYMLQGPATEMNFGTFIKYRFKNGTKVTGEKVENTFGIGIFYRMNDAIIPQIIVDMGTYAIGLSYDANISGYRKVSRTVGGFEITLRYNKLADALFNRRSEYRGK